MFTSYTHSHFSPCIPQSTKWCWSSAMFKCCPTGQLPVASIGRLCMRPVSLAAVRSSNPSRLLGAQHVARRSLQNVRIHSSVRFGTKRRSSWRPHEKEVRQITASLRSPFPILHTIMYVLQHPTPNLLSMKLNITPIFLVLCLLLLMDPEECRMTYPLANPTSPPESPHLFSCFQATTPYYCHPGREATASHGASLLVALRRRHVRPPELVSSSLTVELTEMYNVCLGLANLYLWHIISNPMIPTHPSFPARSSPPVASRIAYDGSALMLAPWSVVGQNQTCYVQNRFEVAQWDASSLTIRSSHNPKL
ncbi:uncharacterized protein BDZ83DRAFT_735025 [Colletotrichum acutatum]|uniref:Uncharacterized protein n=1 Tax=Glomerella acutata TaxID=27357 RepID=A0AAD8XC69_GLOAC|nr:uncharacterized protein BDZ83DRAFT_735025 [Colletotrichum acutatum]KAK1711934.1 hypothetical protein BDZ83DRAFT_735025 [Colletotrichum acutatum]